MAQFVERVEQREAFRQAGLNVVAAFQETGRHLTHDQADARLARLEAGEAVPVPECRH